MSYFFRHLLMKAWGKEIREAWNEEDHPRGKTTPESNSGSFMPKGGGPLNDPAAQTYFQSLHDRGLLGPASAKFLGLKDPAVPTENHKVWDKIQSQSGVDSAAGDAASLWGQQDFDRHVATMTELYRQGDQKSIEANRSSASSVYGQAYADRVLDQARSLAYQNPHGDKIGIGSILRRSWGYDQTNINYYEVTDMTPSGKTVTIREVAQIDRTKERGAGPMSGHTRAVPGKYTGEPIRRRVTPSGRVNFNDYSSLSLWDGKDDYHSWDH